MNYGFVFKAISFIVVVGGIFIAGVIVGGAFATGLTENGLLLHVSQCLPAQTSEELRPCLPS